MITLERTKELLKKPEITDEQAEAIRASIQELVEIIFGNWHFEKHKKINEYEQPTTAE